MGECAIETERLCLRRFQAGDFEALAAMLADPEVGRFIGGEPAFSRDEAWRTLAMIMGHWELRGYGLWAVVARGSGQLLGWTGPWQPEGWPGLEIGWTYGREHWGHGYATEAAAASLAWAHEHLGAREVLSCIDAENERSAAVARRLGARQDGEALLRGKHPVLLWRYPHPG